MNFGFNEEQELLRSTARKFFENECGSDTVRRLMETPEGISPDLWTKLAEQGWLGLVYPEAYDGMGLGLVDLVVLMEEMGRAVVPGPYFSAVLLGGLAIVEAGSEAQKKEWLPKIAAGGRRGGGPRGGRGAPAPPPPGPPHPRAGRWRRALSPSPHYPCS